MKFTEQQYLDAMESYFGPDAETSSQAYKLVKVRVEHECRGVDHDGEYIRPGEMAVRETAIHVDDGRVTCYVCLPCADKWVEEVFPAPALGNDTESE